MARIDLLPCPFCGSTRVRAMTRLDGMFSWVFCGPCGAQGPVEEGKRPEDTPEERWNRRAPMVSALLTEGEKDCPSVADSAARIASDLAAGDAPCQSEGGGS